MAYLAFERTAEVGYDPNNIVAVDINEGNVTVAVFVGGVLGGFVRIETGLGRIAIAYLRGGRGYRREDQQAIGL